MKKIILLGLIIVSIIIISGCTSPVVPPSDKPYITSLIVQNPYIHEDSDEKATIWFNVYNPLQVTFNGKIDVKFDSESCLQTLYHKDEFSIESKQTLPLTVDVSAKKQYSYSESCVGTHTVTITINDVSGTALDTKTGEVNIVQR